MATARQQLGEFGEQRVVKECACPRCKRLKSLVRLPANFKCADVICDFCGYLAQVKATTAVDIDVLPPQILGAAWGPQRERMEAGAIYYLPADLQRPEMFKARKPLSPNARRSGWTGFLYDLASVRTSFVRLR